jgi:alanine-alpha-ketoisovalerate/valine-pyruvate aminotransferase
MIFINTNSLGIIIPKHIPTIQDTFRLELVHQLTHQKFVFDNLTNASEQGKLYLFESDFSQLLDGTYNYYLYSEDELLEDGLLVFGDFESEVEEYQKNITTKAYEG